MSVEAKKASRPTRLLRYGSMEEVTVSELRKNLKDYVGSMARTVVTRDNRPTSVLMNVKDFAHREALLNWAVEDPQGWAEALEAHRRVQEKGAGGVEIDDLARDLERAEAER